MPMNFLSRTKQLHVQIFHSTISKTVGPDLSWPPPIYWQSVNVLLMPELKFHLHYRVRDLSFAKAPVLPG